MSGRIVGKVAFPHWCEPGTLRTERGRHHYHSSGDQGDVWRCDECGRLWVNPGLCSPWRLATWRERRAVKRAQRRAS